MYAFQFYQWEERFLGALSSKWLNPTPFLVIWLPEKESQVVRKHCRLRRASGKKKKVFYLSQKAKKEVRREVVLLDGNRTFL